MDGTVAKCFCKLNVLISKVSGYKIFIIVIIIIIIIIIIMTIINILSLSLSLLSFSLSLSSVFAIVNVSILVIIFIINYCRHPCHGQHFLFICLYIKHRPHMERSGGSPTLN